MKNKKEILLSELNPHQREAVEYCDGPSLVVAGAGSGKTRVLTYKIAYLLESGLKPWNILALTFTNKAAREMKDRIAKITNQSDANRIYMGTFHSIFSRILRKESQYIGYNSSFTIYDESDSRSLLKNIIKVMGYDEKVYKPNMVHNFISMAKNHLITADKYEQDKAAIDRDKQCRMPYVYSIYKAYEARCKQANAMDFDSILVNTYVLFRDNEDVRNKYAKLFEYILVDEYQDTNYAQVAIITQLANIHQHICVVGDDYQSIYSFRGANIDNILNFKNIFKDVQTFKLERNYRSTQFIVKAANSLMKHNEHQILKDVYSQEEEGSKLQYKPCYSDKEEAIVVAKELQRIKHIDNASYSDFAILYRTNAQSRTFEDEFRRQSIPYKIVGGLSFYQRKEIKDIIAYFRLIVNNNDEEAFRRIINYPARGIGKTTIEKIIACASENMVSLWQVITNPLQYGLKVNSGTLSKINEFILLINSFVARLTTTDAYLLGKDIVMQSKISNDIYSNSDTESLSKQENLEEFFSAMQEFVDTAREENREDNVFLTDYLQEIALYSDNDKTDDDSPKVTMMTIHAAKGLEYPTVFIVGLEENIFPSPMSANSRREIEEERRLLYVAITRAGRHCIITNAKNRFRYGAMQFDTPSRFIKDIDPNLICKEESMMADNSCYKERVGSLKKESYTSQYRGYRANKTQEYEPNKPYLGSRQYGSDYKRLDSRFQNNNPVGSQFRADPKPKITERKRAEVAVDPLSARAKSILLSEGGNFRRLSAAITNGGMVMQNADESNIKSKVNDKLIGVGTIIEHQRFGIGEVLSIEGQGENAKAKISFKEAGIRTLLLKFSKYKIL